MVSPTREVGEIERSPRRERISREAISRSAL